VKTHVASLLIACLIIVAFDRIRRYVIGVLEFGSVSYDSIALKWI
jgi:hypothetical protein